MLASILQLVGLVGVVVGLGIIAGVGGFVVGGSAACVYVGLAFESRY